MYTNTNNNISFGVRYDLCDKANIFSLRKRAKIWSLVNKLGAKDVVCIGTRKYKSLDFYSGKPHIVNKDVRVDCIINDNISSVRLDVNEIDNMVEAQLGKNSSKRKQKKEFNNIVFDMVEKILREKINIPRKPIVEESFVERCQRFEKMHDMKLEVRQWSRLKKTYDKDSFFERIRNGYYEIKDSFTDCFEETFGFIF